MEKFYNLTTLKDAVAGLYMAAITGILSYYAKCASKKIADLIAATTLTSTMASATVSLFTSSTSDKAVQARKDNGGFKITFYCPGLSLIDFEDIKADDTDLLGAPYSILEVITAKEAR